jgi:MFS family permease
VTVSSQRGPGLALFGVMLAAVLVPLNTTMIAVALPEIASDLDVSTGATGLLVVVYLVVMLVGQPLSGRLGDTVGARRMLTIGLGGVGVASLAATFVASFPALVAARLVQAVFAAMLVPNVQSILRSATTDATRGRSFGLLGSMIGAGAALGPLIGGLVLAVAGWPAVFFVNIPVVLVALALQRHRVVEVATAESATITEAAASGRILNRVFAGSWVAQAATTFGQYTLILVVPLVLDDRGWGAGAIGVAVSALTIGMVVMGPLGGRFGDRHGRRHPATIGLLFALGALVVMAVPGSGVQASLLIVMLVVFGFGFGFAAPSLMTAAIESVPERRSGTASGIFAMSRYSGSIPASIAFAAVTGSGTTGVDSLLAASAVIAVVAVAATVLLPARPDHRLA